MSCNIALAQRICITVSSTTNEQENLVIRNDLTGLPILNFIRALIPWSSNVWSILRSSYVAGGASKNKLNPGSNSRFKYREVLSTEQQRADEFQQYILEFEFPYVTQSANIKYYIATADARIL
jgi:hypothetical protein